MIDELPPEIDEVRVDGVSQPLTSDGVALRVIYDQLFATYDEAQAAPAVSFQLLATGVVKYTGDAIAGECAMFCDSALCPPTADLILEAVTVPKAANFQEFQFYDLECRSSTIDAKVAP